MSAWECDACLAQFYADGPRCEIHNPTPEQRIGREAFALWLWLALREPLPAF